MECADTVISFLTLPERFYANVLTPLNVTERKFKKKIKFTLIVCFFNGNLKPKPKKEPSSFSNH